MKSFNKCSMINLMKFIYLLFVVFMISRFFNVMDMEKQNFPNDTFSNITTKSFSDELLEQIRDFPYTFHIFTFVIGAFWNAKKILKIGLL